MNRCDRPEELVNIEKCLVHLGFTCLTFFFFLRKKSCMNETTSVYSICKKWPVLISCFYPTQTRGECGAWPYLNTQEAVCRSIWSSLAFQGQHSCAALWVRRTLANHTLPWISSAAFLLKDQNQFDLGICPFPVEWRCALPVAFVDIACVFHLKP